MWETIARQLRRARESLALSIEDAAGRLSVGERELTAWEEGRARPSVSELQRLAEFYGRSMDFFVKDVPGLTAEIVVHLRAKGEGRISGCRGK